MDMKRKESIRPGTEAGKKYEVVGPHIQNMKKHRPFVYFLKKDTLEIYMKKTLINSNKKRGGVVKRII